MKPFDLEAAKRGEPICTSLGTNLSFVGTRSDGRIVVEEVEKNSLYLCTYSTHQLCMAPKKRTVWVNLCKDGSCSRHFDTQENADYYNQHHRIGGKAYPVEIEE